MSICAFCGTGETGCAMAGPMTELNGVHYHTDTCVKAGKAALLAEEATSLLDDEIVVLEPLEPLFGYLVGHTLYAHPVTELELIADMCEHLDFEAEVNADPTAGWHPDTVFAAHPDLK